MHPPTLRLALALLVLACAPDASGSRAGSFPVVWAAALDVASQAAVPARLARVDPEGRGEVLFTEYCHPAVTVEYACVNVPPRLAYSCDEVTRLVAEGYTASTNLDFTTIRAVGAECAAVAAVGRARAARWSAVRDFRLTPSAIDSLPPLLGLRYSNEWDTRARHDAAWSVPWSRSDSGLTATVHAQDGFGEILDVQSNVEIVWVRILGRGDFDDDGWDDLLVDAHGQARGGSLRAFNVYVLTRRAPGEQLWVAREVY